MEKEAWSWPHVLVFQSLKRIAHSPLLNPANSRFLSARVDCITINRSARLCSYNMQLMEILGITIPVDRVHEKRCGPGML